MREWAPNAQEIFLLGEFNNWEPREEYRFLALDHGNWEIILNEDDISHGDRYKLLVHWDGGEGGRIPAWSTRMVQDPETKVFDAQFWMPEKPYHWKHPLPDLEERQPLIYEAHIGMATEQHRVGDKTIILRLIDQEMYWQWIKLLRAW